jgi:hypothetical protein
VIAPGHTGHRDIVERVEGEIVDALPEHALIRVVNL